MDVNEKDEYSTTNDSELQGCDNKMNCDDILLTTSIVTIVNISKLLLFLLFFFFPFTLFCKQT